MKKGLFIGIFLMIVMAVSVFSADLSEFPGMFVDENHITENTVVIVGKAAQAEDVLGSIDIALTIQKSSGNEGLDLARLDTEVKDITAYKSVVVGGPCINSVAAKLMGYPENCMEGFSIGKAFIRLYEFDNDNFAMLVAGTTALDTRRATYVLSHYEDYDLEGKEREVAGLSLSNIEVEVKD